MLNTIRSLQGKIMKHCSVRLTQLLLHRISDNFKLEGKDTFLIVRVINHYWNMQQEGLYPPVFMSEDFLKGTHKPRYKLDFSNSYSSFLDCKWEKISKNWVEAHLPELVPPVAKSWEPASFNVYPNTQLCKHLTFLCINRARRNYWNWEVSLVIPYSIIT